jgi:hypothetical protein
MQAQLGDAGRVKIALPSGPEHGCIAQSRGKAGDEGRRCRFVAGGRGGTRRFMQRGNEESAIEPAVDCCDSESEPRAMACATLSLQQGKTATQIGKRRVGLERVGKHVPVLFYRLPRVNRPYFGAKRVVRGR